MFTGDESRRLVNYTYSSYMGGNRWADWAELKPSGTRGGMIVLWDKCQWRCTEIYQGSYSIACMPESLQEDFSWFSTGIYGPHTNPERELS